MFTRMLLLCQSAHVQAATDKRKHQQQSKRRSVISVYVRVTVDLDATWCTMIES